MVLEGGACGPRRRRGLWYWEEGCLVLEHLSLDCLGRDQRGRRDPGFLPVSGDSHVTRLPGSAAGSILLLAVAVGCVPEL